jgi:DNA-binding LacI/PurR family transcriptional regulator
MAKIQEVAERAGVSLTTVSHVVNHRDRVSPALRARVEKAIEELQYVPDRQAQGLRTGRTNAIAVMIPDIGAPFYTDLVRGLQTAADAGGLDALIYNTDVPGGHSDNHGLNYLRLLKRRRVDGLIVADAALHLIQEKLLEVDVPTVFIGNLPSAVVDSVEQDNFDSASRMAQYLLSRGHRRIAHVTGPSFFNMSQLRQSGFEQALSEGGAPMDNALRFEGSFLSPSGHAAVAWLLEQHGSNLPSAVFFANARMARAALAEFSDRGIVVPRDIAVATYDLTQDMEDIRPQLTTIGVDPAELGRTGLKLLSGRIAGTYTGPPRRVVLPATLAIHTTA